MMMMMMIIMQISKDSLRRVLRIIQYDRSEGIINRKVLIKMNKFPKPFVETPLFEGREFCFGLIHPLVRLLEQSEAKTELGM